MSTAAVVVGVSLAIILVITAVFALRWRNRVRRQREEHPQDRYRREVLNIRHAVDVRTRPRTWRRRRPRDAGSSWATGPTSYDAVGGAWVAGGGGSGGD